MPFFKIETNQSISEPARQGLMEKASAFVSEILGKSEDYVMVEMDVGRPMLFGGRSGPAAYVQLKSIGLDAGKCPALAEKIFAFVESQLGAPPDRTFLDFQRLDAAFFGHNNRILGG